MSGKVKYIKLKRSDNYGFGFSILGGAGSELPPLIYDVIEGSPASKSNQLSPGDIILEINGEDVLSFTTKEVLNCLRLSAKEVILKLKTDSSLKEKVNHLRKAPNNSEILRNAITQDDLQGVKQILAKRSDPVKGNTSESLVSAAVSEHGSPNGSHSSSDDDGYKRGAVDNEWHQQKKPKKKSDESSSASGVNKQSVQRTACATSPPLSEDESDIESLHSFHYSPKAVDIPSAVRLAKRLFALDGFKKSDVSRHLSKNNEFSRAVAEEYLRYFDLRRDTLDIALRKFLDKFCLSGETQERERVLVHFSKHFLDCNPGAFNSQDAVHTLTCALMLLNTDLHSQSVGRKMTSSEFIDNLAELNDGENFNPVILKALYEAIRAEPLKWATDEEEKEGKSAKGILEDGHSGIGSNPFLTTPIGSGVVYKKGYIMRKCCLEPSGKRTAFGKRSWKMWFCVIQDLILYLHKDEQGARRGLPLQMGQNAVRLHHALALKAHDYSKKEHVFRLQTADQAEYLLQTSDSKELQAWIDAINFVAASLSAPPMPGAVGSQRKFQRPLLPCSITKFSVMEQLEDHISRLNQLKADLDHLKANPPDKNAKSTTVSGYKEKEVYLTAEIKRYETYVNLLRSRLEAAGASALVGVAASRPGINELPVFEVNADIVQVKEVGPEEGGDPAGIVPPPIPERPRYSDSDEEDESKERNSNAEDKGIQTQSKKISTDRWKLLKKDDEFKKELEKMIIEKEKRDKKREKEEKKELLSTLRRQKKEQEPKEKKAETKVNTKDTHKGKENELKENGNFNWVTKRNLERKEKNCDHDEDPRVGTLNRLTAIFKFSKLNSRSKRNSSYDEEQIELLKKDETYTCKESKTEKDTDIISFPLDEQGKEIDFTSEPSSPQPPPLPPKPDLNSPIRKNLGTRVINA